MQNRSSEAESRPDPTSSTLRPKFKVNKLSVKSVCCAMIFQGILAFGIFLFSYLTTPPFLSRNSGSVICPSFNQSEVGRTPICHLFNLQMNDNWSAHVDGFTSLEYLLQVRATLVLKSVKVRPEKYVLISNITLYSIEDNGSRQQIVKSLTEEKSYLDCSVGNRYCSIETIFSESQMPSGSFELLIAPLNLEELREKVEDIQMEVVTINKRSNLYFIVLRSILLLLSLLFTLVFYLDKRRPNEKTIFEEKLALCMQVCIVLFNYPSTLTAYFLSYYYGQVYFTASLVTALVCFLFFWLMLIVSPRSSSASRPTPTPRNRSRPGSSPSCSSSGSHCSPTPYCTSPSKRSPSHPPPSSPRIIPPDIATS